MCIHCRSLCIELYGILSSDSFFVLLTFLYLMLSRDGLAKALYSHLFHWLVKRINHVTHHVKKHASIAVLDLHGFEVGVYVLHLILLLELLA